MTTRSKSATKKPARKRPARKTATKDAAGLSTQQRRFCELFLSGQPAARAYRLAGYDCAPETSHTNSIRLLKNPSISKHLEKERARLATVSGVEREHLVQYLVRAIFTPISEIGPECDLCQEHHVEENEFGTKTRSKSVSKLEAAKQLCAIMGWNAPLEIQHQAADPLLELLSSIRGKG